MPKTKKTSRKFSFELFRERFNNFKKDNNIIPRAKSFVRSHPLASFFIALGLLLLFIVLNSVLTPKPEEVVTETHAREVDVYKIGSAPKVSVSGQVEKSGVVTIVAQAPGIVNSVNVIAGQSVGRGTVVVNLASNYTGGNAAGVGAAIANAQYKNVKDTYGTQLDVINKQRQIAEKTQENSEEMRLITEQSVGETRNLITLNASNIVTLEQALAELEDSNVGGANNEAILSTRGLLVQARSANNQLYQGLRNAEYQASGDNPPAELSALGRDIALRQLEVQEKALNLSLETSRLQSALASINASAMAPASPFDGVVERVNVIPGQAVNPGTPLATIISNSQSANIIVKVPSRVADNISTIEPSSLFISGKTYEAVPLYISNEATDGLLYTVIYEVPEDLVGKITDRDFIQVDIPVGYPDAIATIPYLPIDIIFQTQNNAYVYVIENGEARSRIVLLGEVVGGNVSIESGLTQKDTVILDRNIIEGDKVKASN